MSNGPRVYALLSHELARGGGFYPKAWVVVNDGKTQVWHPVYSEAHRAAVASRSDADRIMYPVLKEWLRGKGWEDAEIYLRRDTPPPEREGGTS